MAAFIIYQSETVTALDLFIQQEIITVTNILLHEQDFVMRFNNSANTSQYQLHRVTVYRHRHLEINSIAYTSAYKRIVDTVLLDACVLAIRLNIDR